MSLTTIEWTQRPGTIGEVWNLVTGCNKVDRGCKHCYAETMHRRLQGMGQAKYAQDFLAGAVIHEDLLELPFTWNKPRTVFVNSMSDLFHKDVPFPFLMKAFDVMERAASHTFLILTKRPERAVTFYEHVRQINPWWSFPPNVWLGTSANDQASANKRVPILLKLPGVLRFLSYEPATGALDLRRLFLEEHNLDEEGNEKMRTELDALKGNKTEWVRKKGRIGWDCVGVTRDQHALHWVIAGGESGPKAEPMHPAWARRVRDDCKATGTPFFFKQWGAWIPVYYKSEIFQDQIRFKTGKGEFLFPLPTPQNMKRVGKHAGGHDLDGETWQQFPEIQTPQT